jgi:hypothetical protein
MSHSKWPSWRYGPKGESAVFESEADVPAGWHDHPSKHEKAAKSEPAPTKNSSPAPAKTGGKKAGRPAKAKVPAKSAAPLDL